MSCTTTLVRITVQSVTVQHFSYLILVCVFPGTHKLSTKYQVLLQYEVPGMVFEVLELAISWLSAVIWNYCIYCTTVVPSTTVTVYITHPLADFSMVDISTVRTVGIVPVPKVRRWKHLAYVYRAFRRRTRIVRYLAPSWFSSNRARKTAPKGCDTHRRIRYGDIQASFARS